MKPRRLWLQRLGLAAAAVALLGALAFVALRTGPLAPTRVTVVQAAQGTFKPALFGIGTVEARRSVLVGPTQAGRVRAVAVDVGDLVQAGQVLAEMDPVDLDERTAALDASVARAGSTVAAAQAQAQDALAKRALADANAQRYVDLGAQNFMSPGAVEARLQEQASAKAAAAAAQANVTAAQQDLQRLQAERAGLRQQRANVRLLAPMAGLVVARDAEPGSTVVAGQAVLRLIEPGTLWVRLRLDQGRSAGLAVGLPASIVLRANPQQALPGQVARIEAVSDSVTEERVALVRFDALPAGLSVGEMAEVTLALPATAPAVLLPNASLQRQQGQVGVWMLGGGSADDKGHGSLRFVPVRVGAGSLDGQVQVLQGVQPGDRVVVYSDKEVRPDSRIQVVNAIALRQP
jgi:HlyD family secretion protein